MGTFAERFKSLRIESNLTQEELALRLNVSKGAIGNYESGTRIPRTEDLEDIADFFNVETDYLLGRTNNRPDFTLEERWIIECYRNADNDTKTGIKAILRRYDKKEESSIMIS